MQEDQIKHEFDNTEDQKVNSLETGTIPSEEDTHEALEHDILHDDSSLEPDIPAKQLNDDEELNRNEDISG